MRFICYIYFVVLVSEGVRWD